jgi:hypothetical protein
VKSYRSLILFVFAVTFCACAPRPVTRETRPAKSAWEGIWNVVLLKFDGSEGDAVRRHVHDRFDEVHYFTALDTGGHAIFHELTYETIKDARSIRLGEHVGGDLLVAGRATGVVRDARGTDQAEVQEGTGYFKKEKNLDGEWVDVEITRTVIRTLPYVIRHASLRTDYVAFDARTGKLVAKGTVSEKQDKKFGGVEPEDDLAYEPSEAPLPVAALDGLSKRAAKKLVAEIARTKMTSIIPFDKGHNRLVRRGVVMAGRGDWDDAMKYWHSAIEKEPGNSAAYYNLGIAHETLGDLENLRMARRLYEKAATLGNNALYTDAVARVDRIIDQGRDR